MRSTEGRRSKPGAANILELLSTESSLADARRERIRTHRGVPIGAAAVDGRSRRTGAICAGAETVVSSSVTENNLSGRSGADSNVTTGVRTWPDPAAQTKDSDVAKRSPDYRRSIPRGGCWAGVAKSWRRTSGPTLAAPPLGTRSSRGDPADCAVIRKPRASDARVVRRPAAP